MWHHSRLYVHFCKPCVCVTWCCSSAGPELQEEDTKCWSLLPARDFYTFCIPFEMEGPTEVCRQRFMCDVKLSTSSEHIVSVRVHVDVLWSDLCHFQASCAWPTPAYTPGLYLRAHLALGRFSVDSGRLAVEVRARNGAATQAGRQLSESAQRRRRDERREEEFPDRCWAALSGLLLMLDTRGRLQHRGYVRRRRVYMCAVCLMFVSLCVLHSFHLKLDYVNVEFCYCTLPTSWYGDVHVLVHDDTLLIVRLLWLPAASMSVPNSNTRCT